MSHKKNSVALDGNFLCICNDRFGTTFSRLYYFVSRDFLFSLVRILNRGNGKDKEDDEADEEKTIVVYQARIGIIIYYI